MRTLPLIALLVASLLAASPALADGLKLRALDGTLMRVDPAAHGEPSLLVTFSIDDDRAPVRTQAVRDFARPLGLRVFLVSTDAAQKRVQVKRWARRHAADFPVLTDPDSSIVDTMGATARSSTLLLGSDGATVARWQAWDDSTAAAISGRLAALPRAEQAHPVGAVSVEDMPMLEVEPPPFLQGSDAGGPSASEPADPDAQASTEASSEDTPSP